MNESDISVSILIIEEKRDRASAAAQVHIDSLQICSVTIPQLCLLTSVPSTRKVRQGDLTTSVIGMKSLATMHQHIRLLPHGDRGLYALRNSCIGSSGHRSKSEGHCSRISLHQIRTRSPL